MSNEQENKLQPAPNAVATALPAPARDRAMRSPMERRPATAAEILSGPRRRLAPRLETSTEDVLSDQ